MLAMLIGCGTGNTPQPQPKAERSIYHWKTTFNPTVWELQFLHDHHISRIYLHLFDVIAARRIGHRLIVTERCKDVFIIAPRLLNGSFDKTVVIILHFHVSFQILY